MTHDEPSASPTAAEVFLGPTGSETEEFYSYQRRHPGLDKSQYLNWFQGKFHKEIELRRRRSDQPSDLEFMVIKKRSKYRERIGEESSELVSYAEAHPQLTYRELAEWFQKKYGKEIDITAISREFFFFFLVPLFGVFDFLYRFPRFPRFSPYMALLLLLLS